MTAPEVVGAAVVVGAALVVAAALGVAVPVAVAVPVGVVVTVGVAVPLVVALPLVVAEGVAEAGLTACSYTTWRNRSWAVLPISSPSWSLLAPGMSTSMFWPTRLTSASATPRLLTRLRMTSTAWLRWAALTVCPLRATGWRVALAPPSRSSPSLGVHAPPAATPT